MVKANKAPQELRAIIDDGTREIPIMNKFGKLICKIHIRPADISILDRYHAMQKDIEKILEPLKSIGINRDGTAQFDRDWDVLKSVEQEIKNRFNMLFDMDDADEIFANRNAFSSVGGEFFCTRVLLALGDVIVAAINEEAERSEARVSKYLTPEKTESDADAGSTADNA